MVKPGFTSKVLEVKETFHAFWSKSAQANPALIISAPTTGGSPVSRELSLLLLVHLDVHKLHSFASLKQEGVDFYEMRRRSADVMASNGYNYGPFGVQIPLVEYEGSGFFHCGTL